MRTIQRTISLEPMTSRLPGVLPAYKDNVLYFFDDDALKKREYEFTSNYGMIPVNIMLDAAPSAATSWNYDYTSHCYGQTIGTDENCYKDANYDEFGKFTLSWYTLSQWYKFFTDYYHLLNDWGHCGIAYSSATHYYYGESKNGYSSQMRYGSEKQAYIGMDELFKSRGGSVKIVECNASNGKCNFDKCNSHTIISESKDDGFFKWICENIVPTFMIPIQYRDYWRRDKLYYPDVIKWIGWMSDRRSYGNVDIWNCSESTDCCECEDWHKRGGNDILVQMQSWYQVIQSKILTEINESCAIPTIISPLQMQVSIDDLGEFSIFSTDYELGKDYRTVETESGSSSTVIHYESGNTNSGTIVTMDNTAMILDSGSGFIYDDIYMEKYVSTCNDCGFEGEFVHHCPKCGSVNVTVTDWKKYEPDLEQVACSFEEYDYAYREGNSDIFYYSFDENDVFVSAETEEELRTTLQKRYKIDRCDAILIGSTLVNVEKEEFGVYDSEAAYIGGNTFYVYREEYTDTPFTIINGKKIYADFYPFKGGCEQFFYFPFFKAEDKGDEPKCSTDTFNPDEYKHFPRTRTGLAKNDYKEFIAYAGTQHEVSDTGVTINGNDYIRISSGTSVTPDGFYFITTGGKTYKMVDGEAIEDDEYEVSESDFEIFKSIDDNIQVYVGGLLTGYTISKIYDLRSTALLTDDIGNTIEALYDVKNHYNHQPPEGEKLEPIYQVGNVANVKRFSMSIEKQEDLPPGEPNYFVGDIITAMRFYYRNSEGEEVTETSVDVETPSRAGETTSLKAISASTDVMKSMSATVVFEEGIYCDVTYYIGATLQRTDEEKPFEIADDSSSKVFSSGVCYNETVKFIEAEIQYYLKAEVKKQIPMTENKPSAHTVSYPVTCYVLEQKLEKIESDFNNFYYCGLARFEMPLKTDTDDFELYNGTQVFPVFREEYKMGTACIENIDADIYIDRGINAAFEKHIKLGEVTSMEALEQYTNGYFKIMEN